MHPLARPFLNRGTRPKSIVKLFLFSCLLALPPPPPSYTTNISLWLTSKGKTKAIDSNPPPKPPQYPTSFMFYHVTTTLFACAPMFLLVRSFFSLFFSSFFCCSFCYVLLPPPTPPTCFMFSSLPRSTRPLYPLTTHTRNTFIYRGSKLS